MLFKKKIYAIQHNVTKRMYIGMSQDVETRYMAHIYLLRAGKHSIEDMQSDFDKHGEDYSVFILDEVNEYADRTKEYEWMRKYKTNERKFGYNYKDRAVGLRKVPLKEGLPDRPEDA